MIPSLLTPQFTGLKSSEIDPTSSNISFSDEGIVTQPEIEAKKLMAGRLTNSSIIPIPIGGSELGSLSFESSRIVWRIDHIASMIREPNRYPKIIVSPEFSVSSLTGRMKLFPQGSDQSRVAGNSSFYLRCLAGIVIRYSIDIAGEVMDTFECEYEKQRDKGKHDFVKLNEYTNPDGSISIGIHIKEIRQISN